MDLLRKILPFFLLLSLSSAQTSKPSTLSNPAGTSRNVPPFLSLSNVKEQSAGLPGEEHIIPTPQPQTQGRDWPPFSNPNSVDNERIRERERQRERDRERERGRDPNQFPFNTGRNNQDSGFPFGRPPRPPSDPFTGPTNRNDIDSRQTPNTPFLTRPSTNVNPFGIGVSRNTLIREPRYFVVASKMVRPGQIYRVAVTVFQTQTQTQEIEVRASLLRNGVDIGADTKVCQPNIPETLMIRVPKTSIAGDYRLRVEGNDNGLVGGTAFVNETELRFSERSMTILIQTDKPVYMQGQTVRFRVIPINTALRPFDDAVDVYMVDPRGCIVRRWLSRQSNFGAVSLNYTLSDQPTYGNYSIRVHALQQVEEKEFFVEEYYQPRFEVNVTMPAFFFVNDNYVSGTIVANFTNGAPVRGNLTVKATMQPIDERLSPTFRTSLFEPLLHEYIPNFQGYYEFRFGMWEIERSVPQLDNIEIKVTAQVGDYYWNEIIEGYSKARVYNSSLRLQFLGGSPQVFKPGMPYTSYVSVSYHDGSPLSLNRLFSSNLEVQPEIVLRGGGRRRLESRNVPMIPDHPGIWKITIDFKKELLGGQPRTRASTQLINDIQSLRIGAVFTNQMQETATTEMLAVAHYSQRSRHIHVSSSTSSPKVGEYVVFHVRTNFYMDQFTYLIMSKGVILLTGSETMDASLRTFAISVSPEMAPAATIVVYHVSKYMEVVVDALTFPVNGISRNNFTVKINNKKEKTNNLVEVIIRGQPGAYVGLSGIDSAFYTMQAGNEITYGEILEKMIKFDEDSNGTLTHKWISRDGFPDEIAYFPSHSYGIDVNRTFEYTGLVVFSDIVLPRRLEFCNETAGLYSCLTGNQCYHIDRKCDGIRDCVDGTDESNCPWFNATDLIHFKLNRFNRLQRLYDNSWLWKDINIGPHGHFIVTVPVPERPALWMVSSFGVSTKSGFGLTRHPIIYSGVRPLFMNVEMPHTCRQGEQIGIRISVFNYMMRDIEALVVLTNSSNYKFIHVEAYGNVQSYSPRTSTGEHQHLVWIRAQDAVQVHMPIVPTVLGDVTVTIRVVAQIAQDEITRTIRVEPDGVPQYRHTSVVLDLSSRAFVLQYMHINVTESPIIPYDFDRYYVYSSNLADISLVGDVVGPAFPTMPVNASSLLNKPMESAEQNMFSFAANLYTLMYLRLTNQRDKTTYRDAFHHLNVLYQRQLSFQNPEGSFSYFRSDWNHSSPSVWVTAYCSRVFSEASFNEWENFLFIDPNVISKAISWLLQYQTEEGSFYEISSYANRKLNDSMIIEGYFYSPNITLTSHVLIALHGVKDLPGVIGPKLAVARQKAINYLEHRLDGMKFGRPYDIALVAYALMLSKSPKADSAFIALSSRIHREGGLAYWGRERVPVPDFKLENNKPFLLPRLPNIYDSENIETTAYALQVYIARQELVFVEPIVKWLNTQRLYDGGWASSQDTAAAMRALIDFTIRSNIRNVTDLTVTIEAVAIPNRAIPFKINSERLATPQKLHIENAFGTVKVQAKGAGYAILQLQAQYGVDRPRFITQPPVKAFSLEVIGKFSGRNASYIEYISCQSWHYLEESERSGMAVLEVTIPTGYFVLQTRLDEYVLSGMVPSLRRAKYYHDKVVMYFDYLEINPTCVNFTIERFYPVANMTRYLPIKVYDYYAPERFNETIFDAFDVFILDICQVCGSYQCPYCPIFAGSSIIYPSLSVILFMSSLIYILSACMLSRDS